MTVLLTVSGASGWPSTVTGTPMALTDVFVRQVKHTGKPTGDKHTDGAGMYLLVKAAGK
ncbi:hypothetical protein GCM10028796_01750 [Ramlibacter monticola]